MNIAVVGTGYVGLVTGVVLAHLGNQVVCIDKDASKLQKIASGKAPIYEPGLEEMLVRVLDEGFFSVSDSISEVTRRSDIVFIAVGTPSGNDGRPDLTAVRAVAREIAEGIDTYKVIVNKSTVPVGCGELVASILVEMGVCPDLFDVVSNPEFLREGSAIRDTLEPDRIVIGAKRREAAVKMVELYAPLERPMHITDLNSAELIKYASNSFLAMKISFINAISRVCELSGADIGDVAKGVGADSRIGSSFLQAGLGWGGSCFPKDVLGMISTAEDLGYDFELLQSVVKINDDQTDHLIERLEERLGGLGGKRIGMLGLSFKPNTDDVRDAKSIVMIERILASGGSITAFDPVAMPNMQRLYPEVHYVNTPYEVAQHADALLVVTEWNDFKQMDLAKLRSSMNTPILFDGRKIYNKERAEKVGFEYHTIGVRSPIDANVRINYAHLR